MFDTEQFKLTLPATEDHPAGSNQIDVNKVVVIIGANGTGKTRLGAWIELQSPQNAKVHRVGAQRTLKMSNSVSTSSIDIAESNLVYGYADVSTGQLGNVGHKSGHKWGNEPNTYLQNDYDKLLVYLFSQDYDISTKYRQSSRSSGEWKPPEETKLDIVKRIWEQVLPHRELIFGGGKIEVAPRGAIEKKYSASMMSDGERVAFYLIGQCLAAPMNSIIVIDEPELHIHRIIQTALWDAIEAEREDCKFIYITHDLEFAASKVSAKKIWLKNFDGTDWSWEELPSDDAIPEEILLSVLGSRRPVLFVEGDKGSLDHFLLSHIYTSHSVIPCGGCERVISSASSFTDMKKLHSLECKGLIDRDYRTDEVIAYLQGKGTLVLDLSEIENLLLVEQVLFNVALYLKKSEVEAGQIIDRVKTLVFDDMITNRDRLISSIASFRIESRLKQFNNKAIGLARIIESIEATTQNIKPEEVFNNVRDEITTIIDTKNYNY